MASSSIPSRFACNRFIHYIRKWISSLRQDSVTTSAFISSLMQCIDKEADAMNRYAFRVWCGHSLLPQDEPKECASCVIISYRSSTPNQPISLLNNCITTISNYTPVCILPSSPHSSKGIRVASHALHASDFISFGYSGTQRFLRTCFSASRLFLCIFPNLGMQSTFCLLPTTTLCFPAKS